MARHRSEDSGSPAHPKSRRTRARRRADDTARAHAERVAQNAGHRLGHAGLPDPDGAWEDFDALSRALTGEERAAWGQLGTTTFLHWARVGARQLRLPGVG